MTLMSLSDTHLGQSDDSPEPTEMREWPTASCYGEPRVRFIERVREVARDCGYAVAVHGSQKRDLDLIAVPWIGEATSAQDLVDAICDRLGLHARDVDFYDDDRIEPNPEMKPWGRLAWSLTCPAPWKYLDLSVAPRAGEGFPEFLGLRYRRIGEKYVSLENRAERAKEIRRERGGKPGYEGFPSQRALSEAPAEPSDVAQRKRSDV